MKKKKKMKLSIFFKRINLSDMAKERQNSRMWNFESNNFKINSDKNNYPLIRDWKYKRINS